MEEEKTKPNINQVEKHKQMVVETYTGDMAGVLESSPGGLVKKLIHGEQERENEKKNLSPQSKKNQLFLFISIFLLLFALFALVYLFFLRDNNVLVNTQFVPIVFNDQSTFLEVSGLKKDEIAQTILNEISKAKTKVGGMEGIYLTENKQIVGLRRFIALTSSHLIPGDNKLFVSDNFQMGAVISGTKANLSTGDFFILMKVRSTSDIFDGMRAWENNLLNDLHGFIGVKLSSNTNYLFQKDFTDGLVENKNARILYDKDNNPVLMYIYADNNSVIVTSSQSAAHEIMLRLASNQTQE